MLKFLRRNSKQLFYSTKTITTTSLSSISQLSNTILNSHSPNQALHFLNSSLTRVDPTHNPPLFSATIHVLVRVGLFPTAKSVAKRFVADLLRFRDAGSASRVAVDSLRRVVGEGGWNCDGALDVLVSALSQMGLVAEALWVVGELKKLPSLQACNAVLAGLVKVNRFDLLSEFLNDVVSRGFVPDLISYGILINGSVERGDLLDALTLFDEMSQRGISANVLIYSTIIRGLCERNRMAKAEIVFQRMQCAGVAPNTYTYNALIGGFCRLGEVSRAIELYRRMIDVDHLRPDVVTFGVLVDGFCRLGEVVVARNIFAQMAKFGITPSMYLYTSLIKGYVGSGYADKIGEISSEMVKFRILPDVFIFASLIKSLCCTDKVEEADEMLRLVTREGVVANNVMFNVLIDGYCKKGDMVKALEVRSRMGENNVEPNLVTFSTLIDGYCKAGQMEASMALYREMLFAKILPDVVVFMSLIHGYCKDRNLEEALRLFEEMVNSGISLNAHTLSCLIVGLCQVERSIEALGIFKAKNDKNRKGFSSPNQMTYTSLIHGLYHEGQVCEAMGLFSEMRVDGFRPDVETYIIILLGLGSVRRVVDLMAFHSYIIKIGLVRYVDLGRVLASGYRECGYLKSFSDLSKVYLKISRKEYFRATRFG